MRRNSKAYNLVNSVNSVQIAGFLALQDLLEVRDGVLYPKPE
jgi:hypothetical protein